MNKQKLIIQESNDNPQPLQRQSIKGLFTFYREQQEMQLAHLQAQSYDKAKNHPRQIKTSLKNKQQHYDKELTKGEKSLRKKRSKKDVTMLEESLIKSKKKKKVRKIAKDHQNEQQSKLEDISKTVPIMQEQEDPTTRFLKKIKQHKTTKSPGLTSEIIKQPQKKIIEVQVEQKQRFNRLFYPQESEASQNIVDNLNPSFQKIESVNKLLKFNGRNKKQQETKQIFFQRSSSDIKKSSSERKRTYTQLDVNLVSKSFMGNNVKQNFYSHKKLQEIVRLAHRVGSKQETEPMSPPSEIRQIQEMNRKKKTEEVSGLIKLPEIKKTRLSRELRKVEEVVAQQLSKYGTNKSQKSGKKLNKSREMQRRNYIQYNKKQRAVLKKKLETEPQTYCVALIDLSKSTSKQPELNNINTSWSSKKKLLFKKLGINI